MKLRSVSIACILSVAVGCGSSAVPSKGAAKPNTRELQGTWIGDTEVFGQPGSVGHKWTITAEKIVQMPRVVYDGNTLEESSKTQESTYALDAAKSPAAIDLTPLDGPNKGKAIRGIYKVDGDSLKVCVDMKAGSHERPTDFSTKPGSASLLYKFERAK